MRTYCKIFLLILTSAALLSACSRRKHADLLIVNANIYTVDSAFSVAEAMAIENGKIVATGESERLMAEFDADSITDALGCTVLPGLIDAHCHFSGYATDMWKCDLVGTTSFEDVVRKVQDYAAHAPMYWLYGRGWDQNDWEVKDYPDNKKLNELFPSRPVFLKRIDGHAALVNDAALKLANINASTSVRGGSVVVKDGKPTGLLIDNAMDLVDELVPTIPDTLASRFLHEAQARCFAVGLTQVQDLGITEHMANLIDREQKAGNLSMKVYAVLNDDTSYYDKWIKKGVYKTERLTVGGFKLYADGALGSRGACLLKPYHDQPGWYGFLLRDTSYLRSTLQRLAASGLQVCTHAIGDSANRTILRLYNECLRGNKTRRWRIEHAQAVAREDLKRFRESGIIPSVQPTHATSDMYWASARLGEERLERAYAYKSLLDAAKVLPLGTDFPVEGISPLRTYCAAVSRKDNKGYPEGGFLPSEKLDRKAALRGMTIWASYAIFQENEKGSLETGKAADFVIVDRDIVTCTEKDLLEAKILATYMDGKKVFSLP